ncbi:MAG TPA: hypothetical protein VJ891_10060 [Casimicrobiaceae bacterium]|nr:hypothetical protein [Casimicrobiaceae bacterium]
MRGCNRFDCCTDWHEITLAYGDGRQEDAVRAAAYRVSLGEHMGCRIGRLVVARMIADGALDHAEVR